MTGNYTSPKRVERNGRLVAFEGEVMTMDEAVMRGLVKPAKPAVRRMARSKKTEEAPVENTKEA